MTDTMDTSWHVTSDKTRSGSFKVSQQRGSYTEETTITQQEKQVLQRTHSHGPMPKKHHRSFHKSSKRGFTFMEMNVQDIGVCSPRGQSPVRIQLDSGHYKLQKSNTDPCKVAKESSDSHIPGGGGSSSRGRMSATQKYIKHMDIGDSLNNNTTQLKQKLDSPILRVPRNRSLSPMPTSDPSFYLDPDCYPLVSPRKLLALNSASNLSRGSNESFGLHKVSSESLTVGSIGEVPPSPHGIGIRSSSPLPLGGGLRYGSGGDSDGERSLTPTRWLEEGYKWTRSLSERMKGMRDTAFSAVGKKYRTRKLKGRVHCVL